MNALAGLGPFLRLVLRRDRLRLVLWYGMAMVLAIGVAATIGATYPTEAARSAYAEVVNASPAEVFMIGRVSADTVAGLASWRVQGFVVVVLGLAGAFTVIRHTRTAEEDGYREFMGGAILGRLTPLAGSVIVALGASLVTALVVTAGYAAMGFPMAGSVLNGAKVLAAGSFMTGVGGVTAMIAATSRGASGLAIAIMSVCFAIRGAADAAKLPALNMASPYGWLSLVEPYAADDGRPLLLMLGLVAALIVSAARLGARDVGVGLLSERDGRACARRSLRGSVSLTLRLNRGTLTAWSLAMFAFGGLIGLLVDNTARQLRGSNALSALAGGPDPALGFIAVVVYVFAQAVTVYGIQSILRLRGEEASGRAENVLTAPISRIRWAGGSLVVAVAGTAVIQIAFGLGLGLTYAGVTGDAAQLTAMLAATLVKLPAIWCLVAVAALLFGFAPRLASPVAYTTLGVLVLLELLVELRMVDAAVLWISPYTEVPRLPVDAFDLAPMLVIIAIAVALTVGGALGLRRRDLTRT